MCEACVCGFWGEKEAKADTYKEHFGRKQGGNKREKLNQRRDENRLSKKI